MNKFKSLRIVLSLILSLMTVSATVILAGCSRSGSKESSGKDGGDATQDTSVIMQMPLEFHYNENDPDNGQNSTNNLNAQDPTAPSGITGQSPNVQEFVPVTDASGQNVTEVINVTDASSGEPVTQYVNVTEANGETVTSAGGQPVTEAVPVTEVVDSTQRNPEYATESATGESSYIPYTDEAYAFWVDISKGENYIFNGKFITVYFKIKEDAPDGEYEINITNPDFADLKNGGSNVPPQTVENGKVYVNCSGEPLREFTEEDGFSVYADKVECKQGDEIELSFYMSNNPGLVAMNFWFNYDRNAMEIVHMRAVGEYSDIANAQFGRAPTKENTSAPT